jgi:hypothetical protein
MPEPREVRLATPPPVWPEYLPTPEVEGFTQSGPTRVESAPVLFGPTRLAVKARTAPPSWRFVVFFTAEEMQLFEAWYRDAVENHDGEFYARWIGGSRITAFSQAYQYTPLGRGYALEGTVIRTRIDHSACDEYLGAYFPALYVADLQAVDHYVADLAAVDVYKDDFDLAYIAAHEC